MHTEKNALTDAFTIQKNVAEVGFDWPHVEGVFDKVLEEVEEVREVSDEKEDDDALELELGDLLFAVVNLCRALKIHPEAALDRANAKFEKRFRRMCDELEKSGKNISEASLEEMDDMWTRVKAFE